MTRTVAVLLWLALAQAALAQVEACYLLVRSRDGAVLAEHRPDALMTPASTLKIVSAAAVLEHLGPQTRLETRVRQTGVRRGPVLDGDLVLEGGFDPGLGTSDLRALAARLSAGGLRRVRGRLLVHDPWPGLRYPPGWAWEDMAYPFSAPVAGLVVDEATVEVPFKGTRAVRYPGEEGLVILGTEEPHTVRLAVVNPALHAGEVFERELEALGILVEGGLDTLSVPSGEVFVVHRSASVESLLRGGLAESHNLTMEMLFARSGRPVPADLRGRVVDGSGLSRYNLISPRGLVGVLVGHPELAPLLPAPGEGTMAERFSQSPAAPFVRAKTGTMGGISGLAGFLFPGEERECVFAILINGSLEPAEVAKRLEEELVEDWARSIAWPYLP